MKGSAGLFFLWYNIVVQKTIKPTKDHTTKMRNGIVKKCAVGEYPKSWIGRILSDIIIIDCKCGQLHLTNRRQIQFTTIDLFSWIDFIYITKKRFRQSQNEITLSRRRLYLHDFMLYLKLTVNYSPIPD